MIKGVRWETGKIEQKVNKFIKENLDVEVAAKKVYKLKIKEKKRLQLRNQIAENKREK